MDDRSRQRQGRHASVAGDAADRVIESLVAQFDDPYAFVRELIQNSLDAGAVRIDVDMSHDRERLTIAVRDDGEGMDRETIEGYLLVKFRSTKEQDLTKIGKFGIGFVSLFAMKPDVVHVDTGRDGLWHRVTFTSDLAYTLLRMDDPLEGTTVTLEIPCSAAEAAITARKVRDRAERWCRHVAHDIRTSATGIAGGWGTTPIRAPFTVESPVLVRDEGNGYTAVLGISNAPRAGFYNRGLTLLEEEGNAYVPGVSFKVDDGRLEHTLTRDNVIRDAAFARLIANLQATARTALGAAVHEEAEQAARSRDRARLRRLWEAVGPSVAWTWRNDARLLPSLAGEPIALRALLGLTGGWLTQPEVVFAPAGDALGLAVAAAGIPVLLGDEGDPHLSFVRHRGVTVLPCASAWQVAVAADLPEGSTAQGLITATAALLHARLVGARLFGDAIAGDIAYTSPNPHAVARAGTRGAGTTAVNVEHPLFTALCELPSDLGAPVLARALIVDGGLRTTVNPLAAARAAAEGR